MLSLSFPMPSFRCQIAFEYFEMIFRLQSLQQSFNVPPHIFAYFFDNSQPPLNHVDPRFR